MEGFVYILESCNNKRFYVGSSVNPEKRLIEQHNMRKVMSTKLLVPWKLIFKQKYGSIREARRVEYRLKRMKSRKILEKIIKSGVCLVAVG